MREFPPEIIKLSPFAKITYSFFCFSTSPPTFSFFHFSNHTSGLLLIQKLLQVLRSQLAFVQNLFQREPESLRCQEDEWVQLEARAKALQYQALEQEVASQRRIQVCSVRLLRAI